MNEKDTMLAWVVLSVVTFTLFLEIGIIKGLSVLLPDIKEQLESHTWIIGSCLSIITGWGYLLGLSAAALVKIFGVRICLMTSGLVSSIGLIVCACATSVYMLLFGLLLVGFLLLQEIVAVGIIPEYFDKYFNTAVSVYCFGTAVAIMIIPVLTQTFLDKYGWRGALVLLSGLSLHSVPCGALLKNRQKVKQRDEAGTDPLLPFENSLPDNESCQEISAFQWLQSILFDTSLPNRLPFITHVLLPEFVLGYTFTGWLIYIVSFAQSHGASMRESSIVATSGGIGVAIIRLAVPFLNKLMTYRQLILLSSFIMTISLALITFWTNILGMNVTSFLFGIGTGMLGTEIHIAAKDIADENEYFLAVGWLHLAYGLASLLSGTITGLIFDVMGSFTLSFIILAVASFLIPISIGLETVRSRNYSR